MVIPPVVAEPVIVVVPIAAPVIVNVGEIILPPVVPLIPVGNAIRTMMGPVAGLPALAGATLSGARSGTIVWARPIVGSWPVVRQIAGTLLAAAALTRAARSRVATGADTFTTATGTDSFATAARSNAFAASARTNSFAATAGTDLFTAAAGAGTRVAGQIADVRTRACPAARKSARMFVQELCSRASSYSAASDGTGASERAAAWPLNSTAVCAGAYATAAAWYIEEAI
jgi:hypothetical protein